MVSETVAAYIVCVFSVLFLPFLPSCLTVKSSHIHLFLFFFLNNNHILPLILNKNYFGDESMTTLIIRAIYNFMPILTNPDNLDMLG